VSASARDPLGVQAGFHLGEDRTEKYVLWNERIAGDIEDNAEMKVCLVLSS
jgi:hypothetical protein